jgi:hypothetical protein
MFEIFLLISSLIFVTLSMLGYGLIINNENKNDLFFLLLIGYFVFGLSSLLLHFFFPVTSLISTTILIFGLFLFIKKIKYLNHLKIIKKIFIFIVISFLLLSFSEHPIDTNMYHHPYVSYIKSEKIIFGIAEVQFRFGHVSFLQYVQAITSNKFLHELTISAPNIILYSFFLFFCADIILKNYKKRILFILTILISSFVLIKLSRYREFGNDLIPFIAASYLLLHIVKNIFYKKLNKKKIISIFPLYSIFIFAHKISYLFTALIFLVIFEKKDDFFKLFKNKTLIIVFLIFSSAWLTKNIITTSCLAYPLVVSCIENTSWYLTGMANPVKASWLTELWAKDFITKENWKSLDLNQYINSFQWVPNWLNNHFIKILEKTSPIYVIFVIIYSYLIVSVRPKKLHGKTYVKNKNFIYLIISILIGLCIWFVKAPIFRYGSFYIVSFISLVFIFFIKNKIYQLKLKDFKKLKLIFTISIIFFIVKNTDRQFKSKNNFFPLTKVNISEYKNLNNNEPRILRPKTFGVCYFSGYICSHEVRDGTKFKKIKGYYFLDKIE